MCQPIMSIVLPYQRSRSLNKGIGKLYIDGKLVGTANFDKYGAFEGNTETFDVGSDVGSPVTSAYTAQFAFTGKIEKVQVELK